MKKQFIVVCIALIAFVQCQKEQGRSLITYRNVTKGNIISVKGAYLYIQSLKDSIVNVEGIPDNKFIYSYFNNHDSTIYEVGHCWSVSNTQPVIEKDSSKKTIDPLRVGNGVYVKNLIQNLRYFTTYYIRTYVKTKRLLSHNNLNGENTFSYDIGYGVVDTFTTSGFLDTWAKRSNLGIGARQGAVSFVVGDTTAYVGTGDANGEYRNDFWKYSQKEDTWTQCAVATTGSETMKGRKDAVAFVCKQVSTTSTIERAYIGTGLDKDKGTLKDFWEYTPSANTWRRVADLGGSARFNAVAFAIGDYGYVGTGEGAITDGGATTTATFLEYNRAENKWTTLSTADFGGGERRGAISFVIDGKAYVGTGYDGVSRTLKKDMWRYTPPVTFQGSRDDGAWSQVKDFGGEVRQYAVATVVNGSAYVGYGEAGDGTFFRDWYKYTPANDTWIVKQIGTSGGGENRKKAVAFSLKVTGSVPRVYMGTGFDGTNQYREDLWEYIPDDVQVVKK